MSDSGAPRRFATTRWSVVLGAADSDPDASRQALGTLCSTYWYPLYAFARRRGQDAHSAQDLVQGFFATLLAQGAVRRADPARGRFRTFLLTAFQRHAAKEHEKATALKRGGGVAPLPLDFEDGERRYLSEPADHLTAERIFERRWALTLLERVLAQLREQHARAGKAEWFDTLRAYLGAAGDPPPHAEVAARLEMSEGAVKVAVHRLRRRYRDLLRAEIAQTVEDDAAVDDEIRHLIAAVGTGLA